MFSSTSSIYNWPLFQWFQTWGTCTICCIVQSKVYNDKIQFSVAVWIGKWVNTYISCFVHSVLSYSTYNIPSLTEYIPVFPAKGLDDGGDCRAGHIRLHSTIVRRWLITWSISVNRISSGTTWGLRAPQSLPPILPPRTLTPLRLPRAGCSFTWPGASMFRNCTGPDFKLYTYMFGSIHNHGQYQWNDADMFWREQPLDWESTISLDQQDLFTSKLC